MAWWNFSSRKRLLERNFDAEIQFHIDALIREKMDAGVSESEAKREAILEFGGAEQMKEEIRDVHRIPMLETAMTNVRLALRQMRKSPSYSMTVIITLALGIGANSAVFSAINAILLRPLPFPDSQQLVTIREFDRSNKAPPSFVAPARLEDWNRLNSTFQAISGYYTSDVSGTTGVLPEKVTEALTAPRFLEVWGVAPMLGRTFTPAEEHFGGPAAVIISQRYWVRRFRGDPQVVGKRIRLEKQSVPVIGVLPASFHFLDGDVDVYVSSPPDAPYAQSRESTWFTVIGRLKRGVSVAEGRANLATVQAQLGAQFPKSDGKLRITVDSLKQVMVGKSGQSLWLLFGAVSLLLLIACTNIAALLLARATQRHREISVRFSLGASRGRITVQLLTECFLLALIGSGLGVFIAGAGISVFRKYAAAFPRTEEINLDWRMVLYTLACSLVVTLLCGLAPAVRATRVELATQLADSSRSQVSTRNPIQWLLVGMQVCLAVTLLVGAGLMLRSFQELGRVYPGFEMAHVLTLQISANWGETTNYKALTNRIDRTLDTLRVTPGVMDAASSDVLPGVPGDTRTEVRLVEATPKSQTKLVADSRFVSARYFSTMQIPLLQGAGCSISSSSMVVVNRSFMSSYLGDLQALGRHVALADDPFHLGAAQIVGIAGDAREEGLSRNPAPTIYWCVSAPTPSPYFLIRTQGDPMAMAQTLRRELHTLFPARSVYGISPLEKHLSDTFAENRLRTTLLAGFSVSAFALACTGLYGTLSYFVTTHRREVGLRLALGAERGQIIARFFVKGVMVALSGCVAGLVLSELASRVLASMLFGVTTYDWRTLLGVVALVLAVAAGSCIVPALRAAAVEPMEVLRDE